MLLPVTFRNYQKLTLDVQNLLRFFELHLILLLSTAEGNHQNHYVSKVRSSQRRCSAKKCLLKNFAKFKKRLWHRCFPVNFAKFLRIPFWQNTFGRQLYVKSLIFSLHINPPQPPHWIIPEVVLLFCLRFPPKSLSLRLLPESYACSHLDHYLSYS